ncbi:unnamed protein product [Schistocephalus solidus]|uniref:Transmembrane protein n=1 Tax=Schistocephalus solidus TaxID=70667 RepID=A0A183SHQ4_SCHSO|nr:unnamed protein product [Schistocephalus solidus]
MRARHREETVCSKDAARVRNFSPRRFISSGACECRLRHNSKENSEAEGKKVRATKLGRPYCLGWYLKLRRTIEVIVCDHFETSVDSSFTDRQQMLEYILEVPGSALQDPRLRQLDRAVVPSTWISEPKTAAIAGKYFVIFLSFFSLAIYLRIRCLPQSLLHQDTTSEEVRSVDFGSLLDLGCE